MVNHGLDILNGEERALCTGIQIQARAAWLLFLELVSEPDKIVNVCLDPSINLRQYHALKVGGCCLDLGNVTGPSIKHVVPIATKFMFFFSFLSSERSSTHVFALIEKCLTMS